MMRFKSLYHFFRHVKTFFVGYRNFNKTTLTTKEAYGAMRQLFVSTHGLSNDVVTSLIKRRIGKYEDVEKNGLLNSLTENQWTSAIEAVRADGFHVFDVKLPDSTIQNIYSFAEQEEALYLDLSLSKPDLSEKGVIFDKSNPVSPRYQFPGETTVNLKEIQSLVFDTSLMKFAQDYLGSKPILDLIAFWWSVPFRGKGASEAAQMFHFDLDRIKFLKFFFYLTDVDTLTGPHCFVKGSHNSLPTRLARDGRFTDSEISAQFSDDKIVEICGKQGSLIAVDTRGFHKGKELSSGLRLLLQIQFSNSLFGQSYPKIPISFYAEQYESTFLKYPFTYQQIFDVQL